ncbi:helix-turn-helix domain-containing protein [Arthrobacter agilis]|uniref:Helix-turn-helix domain-containing protein n=1 Tax=Arthrobacter agilis TaxID=37921 RepID=A0A2L0UH04_9MICC|nr:helix-turn-helix domain-containing protein [Arthrobacter agilis]
MEHASVTKLLTLNEVAELLRKSPSQMRWMRHNGSGPRGAKLGGRLLYRESDVIDWIQKQFDDQAAA